MLAARVVSGSLVHWVVRHLRRQHPKASASKHLDSLDAAAPDRRRCIARHKADSLSCHRPIPRAHSDFRPKSSRSRLRPRLRTAFQRSQSFAWSILPCSRPGWSRVVRNVRTRVSTPHVFPVRVLYFAGRPTKTDPCSARSRASPRLTRPERPENVMTDFSGSLSGAWIASPLTIAGQHSLPNEEPAQYMMSCHKKGYEMRLAICIQSRSTARLFCLTCSRFHLVI